MNEVGRGAITDAEIKHMVNRFLGWRLPDDFNPDAGISFKKTFNDHLPQPTKHEPTGTNIFTATQAEAMVRYMTEGLATAPTPSVQDELLKAATEAREMLRELMAPDAIHSTIASRAQWSKCDVIVKALDTAIRNAERGNSNERD